MKATDYIILFKTLLIGSVGGVIALYLSFPAPFLMGPAIAVTFSCLMGIKLQISSKLRDVSFIFIGMSMGSSATPEVIETAKQWPSSFIILAISLYLIMLLGAWSMRRFFHFSAKSSILASTPGHLSFVIALSDDLKSDTKVIALIQSVRILFLTLLIPSILIWMDLSLPENNFIPQIMHIKWIIILGILAAILGYGLKKYKLPAAYLIAGMLASTLPHITGVVEGVLPTWIIIPCFIIMGSLIGTRFSDVKLSELKKNHYPKYLLFSIIIPYSGYSFFLCL
ncbi:MAG: AbrB family transcriptional regulator [Rhizobiales bacterium]|nr:AbrB family transcriptional regulator [Hyphomicrobiales bacterium]